MKKDFYKSFDEKTKTKLEFFTNYFQESFPVFLHGKGWESLFIYDFFAGQGKDENGIYGTSLGILETVSCHCQAIKDKSKQVYIILNDLYESEQLKKNVSEFLEICRKNCKVQGECNLQLEKNLFVRGKDFEAYFNEIYPKLAKQKKAAKIIFIDPFNFVINSKIFEQLTNLTTTDFICFIPSSYLRRFKELDIFNKYIDTNKLKFDESRPEHCHRVIANYFQSLIPETKEYYFSYFSIRKDSNIYGLIFGTNHTLGAEKFLKICWDKDNTTGEADYNIDRELCYNNTNLLFEEHKIPLKLKDLQIELTTKILSGSLKTDNEVYKFTLRKRCLPKHANEVFQKLISENKIKKLKTYKSDIHKHDIQNIELI